MGYGPSNTPFQHRLNPSPAMRQDLPTIGVNERGMLVASLLLEATRYAEPDPAYIPNSISQGQIKQYLLDTCADDRFVCVPSTILKLALWPWTILI
jgi:hypothetical protein